MPNITQHLDVWDEKVGNRCVFCGTTFSGQGKNKEHIIPKWLVKKADLKRRMGRFWSKSREFNYKLSEFTMNACKICNDKGSKLEENMIVAFEKIETNEDLDDVDHLAILDWLDKLRIGFWLWNLNSFGREMPIKPRFYINSRIGAKDRFCVLYKISNMADEKGIEFLGINKHFLIMPSVIGFLINNILFISCSYDLILTRFRFNFGMSGRVRQDGSTEIQFDFNKPNSDSVKISSARYIFGQCIVGEELAAKICEKRDAKFSKGRSEIEFYDSEFAVCQKPVSYCVSPPRILAYLSRVRWDTLDLGRFLTIDSLNSVESIPVKSASDYAVIDGLRSAILMYDLEIEHLKSSFSRLLVAS